MGQLIEMNGTQTMSSLEIAKLTGKRHDHILRDIRVMLEEIQSPQNWGDYKDGMGRSQPCLMLDKEESLCLVTGYSAKLRMAVIKRWQELEEGAASRPAALSHVDQIKGLLAAGLLTVAEAENAVLRSVGMRKLPSARTKAASKKPHTHAVAHGLTFEQAIQEFVANMSGTGTMPTEDAYLLFCEMYGTNMARRNKFVAAVRVSGADKRPMRFDGISRQGFIFH